MHALLQKTKIVRANLNKSPGTKLVPAEPGLTRCVRLVIPPGVIVALSLEEQPVDIAGGIQGYQWPEIEGPQYDLVFHMTGEQELWAILSTASPAGLAPRCSVIIEYPAPHRPE